MRKKTKLSVCIAVFVASFLFQATYSLAFFGGNSYWDGNADMKRFESDFYEEISVDFDKDIYVEINNMSRTFREAWHESDAISLTSAEQQDYSFADVYDISVSGLTGTNATVKVKLGGQIDEETRWVCFVWDYDENAATRMFLALYASDSELSVIDYENEEIYEAEFEDATFEFIFTMESAGWSDNNLKFISIAYEDNDPSEGHDIFVDIHPNPVNYALVFTIVFSLIFIILTAILVYLIYKNK